jgi:acyl-CoA synthetase (AMP-forming)/AMP-acid ligase II
MHSGNLKIETFRDFLSLCNTHGKKPALTDSRDGRTLSYADVEALSYELAYKLPASLSPGARVILYDLDPLDFVPVFFALMVRGLIAVPLDTRVTRDFFD